MIVALSTSLRFALKLVHRYLTDLLKQTLTSLIRSRKGSPKLRRSTIQEPMCSTGTKMPAMIYSPGRRLAAPSLDLMANKPTDAQ